jgi:hypothetical protein
MRIPVFAAALALAATQTDSPSSAARGENAPPVCEAGPEQTLACQGATTVFQLDASASYDPEGGPLTFLWQACPLSFLTDPTNPVTQLVLDTSLYNQRTCGVRCVVTDDQGQIFVCRTYVHTVAGSEGCTPGYWKNHLDSWADTGYSPSDDFDTIFGVDAFDPDRTLRVAISTGGGGLNKLARFATAALLSAANPEVHFPMSIGQVIDQVHDAIVSGQYEPLATTLDGYANLGCPID